MKRFRIKRLLVVGMASLLVAGTLSLAGCGEPDAKPYVSSTVEESAGESESIQGEVLPEDNSEEQLGDQNQEQGDASSAIQEEVFVLPVFDQNTAKSLWTTTDVKFRTEPNTDCDVIKVLKKGTQVQTCLVEEGAVDAAGNLVSTIPEDWTFVLYEEQIGFVSGQYLTDEKPKEPEPGQKVEAIPGQHRDPNNIVICIDPGHQGKGDSKKEPNGPGSSDMKARVTSGTEGVATGVAEYVMSLEVSLMLREELENRGYTVYMTRTTHDVSISNMERAQYSTQVGADIAIRVHCNSVDNSSVRGAETMAPSKNNPYVSHLAKASQSLSKYVIDEYCKATGLKNRGVQIVDNMTGINWSEIPVTIIELGFMSNPDEDVLMQDAAMKNNMVQGMANGIDAYFGLN